MVSQSMTSSTAERDARQLHADGHNIAPGEIAIGVIIGRTSEFFDFFVYAIASVLVFPKLVFPYVDALTGTLEGGLPVLSVQVGCWVAESEVAIMLADVEKRSDGCQIGSYPFFREGRTGANFVVRSTNQRAMDACAADLVAELAAIGRDPVMGGI